MKCELVRQWEGVFNGFTSPVCESPAEVYDWVGARFAELPMDETANCEIHADGEKVWEAFMNAVLWRHTFNRWEALAGFLESRSRAGET